MVAEDAGRASGRRFDEQELLDAARTVFHAHGYSTVQVADIARQAGTTKPTLYARLGPKEQIYRRVIEREVNILRAWITDAFIRGTDMSLAELADIGTQTLFRFAAQRPEGFDLLLRGDRAAERPINLRRVILHVVTDMLADLITRRRGTTDTEPTSTDRALAAACVGVAVQVCENAIDRGQPLEEAQHLAAQFIANAFRHLDLQTPNGKFASTRGRDS
jgi:AcrR family transcriptional regulator